jgi:phosphate acetyltransferase
VAEALGAKAVFQGDEMEKVVTDIKVLAMSAEHALEYISDKDGYLLITPGDRIDNIFAAILAQRSVHYPTFAGLVLTGGMVPPRHVSRLLRGISGTGLTVLSVEADTYKTALKAGGITGQLSAGDHEKLDIAHRMVEKYVDIDALYDRLGTMDTDLVTPAMFQYRILQKARAQKRHIVLPEGNDRRIIQAAAEVLQREICEITILGDEDEVRRLASELQVSIESARLINPETASAKTLDGYADTLYELRKHKSVTPAMARDLMVDPVHYATMMVYTGDADGFVSGATHSTANTLGPVLRVIKTKPGVSLASSVFFMCMPTEVLVYADCALVQNPNAEELADIAITSADTAQAFGIDPYVAMLSYSTGQSGSGEDVDKVREATRIARERRPELPIEGPIQYDAAVSSDVAQIKAKDSKVAGRATVYIFPDLDAGNTAYKAVQRSANVPAIGPVMQGLAKPANDLSRGALVVDIVYTIAVTAIQAQEVEKGVPVPQAAARP